jgi:hypothetical protein
MEPVGPVSPFANKAQEGFVPGALCRFVVCLRRDPGGTVLRDCIIQVVGHGIAA